MNEREVTRIAVRASMAAMATMLAFIMGLYLVAAVASPRVNLPGIHLSHERQTSGD